MDTPMHFETPSFLRRLKGMLGVDFYRLFHTPLYYIFLGIAAMIPALILGTGGMENPQTGEVTALLYTNVWNAVAADTPLYAFRHIGEYANMNMVFIFGGIMVSVFIGHDYKSGYVKQLFTTHAKKQDYMMSKTIVCAFAMACMCLTYLVGAVAAGMLTGLSFSHNIGSLILAILSKMILSLGWASLYTFLNVIFRRHFGISIVSSFFFGTGLPVIALGMVFGNGLGSALNIFLYGSSVYACLSATPVTLLVCLLCSVAWTAVYNLAGTALLGRSDVY